MEIELKNCPFCGGEATIKQQKVNYGISGTIIRCATCGATICQQDKKMVHDDVDGGFKNECVENHTELAIAAWNRRAEKQGEWKQEYLHEYWGEEYDEVPFIKCVDCGHTEWHIDTETDGKECPNYCPTCGAKMSVASEPTL